MTDITDRIVAILDRHYGGWIDNGKTDTCRCPCGHRPTLGESHSSHVTKALIAELGRMGYAILKFPGPEEIRHAWDVGQVLVLDQGNTHEQ